MDLHQLDQVELGLLQDLDLADVDDGEGEDALGGLLDLAADLLGDAVFERGRREGVREGGRGEWLVSNSLTSLTRQA